MRVPTHLASVRQYTFREPKLRQRHIKTLREFLEQMRSEGMTMLFLDCSSVNFGVEYATVVDEAVKLDTGRPVPDVVMG